MIKWESHWDSCKRQYLHTAIIGDIVSYGTLIAFGVQSDLQYPTVKQRREARRAFKLYGRKFDV